MSGADDRIIERMDKIDQKLDNVLDIVRSDQADIKVLTERVSNLTAELAEFKTADAASKQEIKDQYVTKTEMQPLAKLAWAIITAMILGIGSFVYNAAIDITKNTEIISKESKK